MGIISFKLQTQRHSNMKIILLFSIITAANCFSLFGWCSGLFTGSNLENYKSKQRQQELEIQLNNQILNYLLKDDNYHPKEKVSRWKAGKKQNKKELVFEKDN